MKTPEGKTKMDKQQVLNQLRNAKEIYVIMSLCTRMPYVVCDKETFDDEVLIYFTEEDVKREGKRLVEEKIPVQIAKVDANQMLHFYGNLYTMGVNCLMVDQYMDSECRIQLPELVSRPGQNKPDTPEDEKKTWIENPSLHLTALYFMQELRRQKFETMPEELKEMQEEILADFTKGTYITAFQEGSGVPLIKQKNGDAYQPIFTDIIEFGKFNAKNQFKAIAVTANKIPSILVKEAKGVVVNPFGVNLQMPITKRTVPNPEAAAQAGTPEEVQATQVEVKADSERAGAQEEAEAENKTEN